MMTPAIRAGAFALLFSLPLAAWAAHPAGGAMPHTLVVAVLPAIAVGWCRHRFGRTDKRILADMETNRLKGENPGKDGPYAAGETQVDPCPVSRRLSESRRAQDTTLVALSIMTAISLATSSRSIDPPSITGAIFVLGMVTMFLMTLGPRIEHASTSRRTSAPAWHRCQADSDDSSKGAWFVESGSMQQDPILVERMIVWFVYMVGTMLLTAAYVGHVSPGS